MPDLTQLDLTKEVHPWTAEFVNGERISMLDVGREIPFRLVLDKEELLTKFYIHLANDRKVGVDLTNGFFTFDGRSWFPAPEHVTPRFDDRYRIIYYRRMQMEMTSNPRDSQLRKPHAILYVLGWQTVAADGLNYQRILEIEPNFHYKWETKR